MAQEGKAFVFERRKRPMLGIVLLLAYVVFTAFPEYVLSVFHGLQALLRISRIAEASQIAVG